MSLVMLTEFGVAFHFTGAVFEVLELKNIPTWLQGIG